MISENAARRYGRVSRRVVMGLTLGLAMLAWAGSARADMVTFTLTGPNISGTLNGVAFDAPFTITATGDPAGMVWGNFVLGGINLPYGSLAATSTMTIDGVATFAFSDPQFGPMQQDLSGIFFPGFFSAGFGLTDLAGGGSPFMGFRAQGTATGDQIVNGGITVDTPYTFATTAGDLIISGYASGDSSYRYLISSPVPEPSTWVLGLIAAAVTGILSRRSRRTPA